MITVLSGQIRQMKALYLERNPRDNQTDGVLYMPSGREEL